MWALDFLGLDTDADEKAIKRAYAKQLKTTRPDDDPKAFQRLNEAYQAALTWRKNNALLEDNDDTFYNESTKELVTSTGENEPDAPNNEAQPIETSVALHRFYKQTMQLIAKNESYELKGWLTDNALLVDIEPDAITQLFLNHWQKYLPSVSSECFAVVDELFQLNNIQLGDRLNAIWESQQPTKIDNDSSLHNKRERINSNNFIDGLSPKEQPAFHQFYKQCMQIIAKNNPDELRNWLAENIFLSGVEQQTITALFLNHWQNYLPPVSFECFEVIDELFQLNNKELKNTLHIIWQSKQQTSMDYDENTENEITDNTFFDSNQLCQQCVNIAQQNSPETLKLWLNTRPQLWSIENKQQFKDSLIEYLLENPIGIQKNCFSIFLDFFDLNMVQDSLDHQTIVNLQNSLHGLWLFEPQHTANLKNKYKPIARFSSLKPDIENNWQLLEQLQKPFVWSQAFLASFPTSRAKHWGRSLRQFLDSIDNQIPDTICQKQLNYWLSFDQKGLHTTKLIRWTIINLVILLLTFYPSMLCVAYFYNKAPTSLLNAMFTSISIYAIPFFLLAAINMILLIFIWYCVWLKTPYYTIKNADLRIITIAITPSLCIISAIFFLNNSQYSLVFLLLALVNVMLIFKQSFDNNETNEENPSYIVNFLYTITMPLAAMLFIIFKSPFLYCILGYIGIRIAYNVYRSDIIHGANINILSIIDIGSIPHLIYWISIIIIFITWLAAYHAQKTAHEEEIASS